MTRASQRAVNSRELKRTVTNVGVETAKLSSLIDMAVLMGRTSPVLLTAVLVGLMLEVVAAAAKLDTGDETFDETFFVVVVSPPSSSSGPTVFVTLTVVLTGVATL